jgi:hypothetical protein
MRESIYSYVCFFFLVVLIDAGQVITDDDMDIATVTSSGQVRGVAKKGIF